MRPLSGGYCNSGKWVVWTESLFLFAAAAEGEMAEEIYLGA
jgi:hypothetical protein